MRSMLSRGEFNFQVSTFIESKMGNEYDILVKGFVTPNSPGKAYGPPEDCYPPEPGDFEVEKIFMVRKKKTRELPESVFEKLTENDAFMENVEELAREEAAQSEDRGRDF